MKLLGVKFYTVLLAGARIYTALLVGTGIDAALLALQAPKFTALFAAASVKFCVYCGIGVLCVDKILKFTAA